MSKRFVADSPVEGTGFELLVPLGKNANMRSRVKIGNRVQARPRRGAASSNPFINCPADQQYCGT